MGYTGSGKLADKVAIVTGGDSGIGRSVAVHFAREGAHVAIVYRHSAGDAGTTCELVEAEGRRCILIKGDLGDSSFCREVVARTVAELGKLDILVNNAAEQHEQDDLRDIHPEQLERTFRSNIYSMFYLTAAALPHLGPGSAIINTSSVVAFRGSAHLLDYAATKGAVVAFTRSLAHNLLDRTIRVNGVAPGPIWTPLIPASFDAEKVATFGSDAPLGRAGQPSEVAPCFVFLASADASYMTGQFLHPNGGEIVS